MSLDAAAGRKALSAEALAEGFVCAVIAAALVFAPLPIGSVRPGPVLAIELMSFSAFLALLAVYAVRRTAPFTGVREYVPFLAFVAVCVFQIIPLPGPLLRVLSPEGFRLWENAGAVLAGLGMDGAEGGFHTLSLYPGATVRRILFLLACFVFAVAVSRTLRDRRRLTLVLAPVFALLLFEAALGVYQYLSSAGSEDANGTFVNRNHFAGYIEMVFPLALGCVLAWGGAGREGRMPFPRGLVFSENFQRQALLVFLLGAVLLAAVFSRSRMGVVSTVLSLVFFSVMASRLSGKGRGVKWAVYTVILVTLIFGVYAGLSPVVERYSMLEESLPARTLLWKDAAGIVGDFPLFGTGLGTFGQVYPLYKDALDKPLVYLYAHNDYLQLLTETGIAGFLALMTALSLFAVSSMRTLSRLSSEGEHGRFFICLGAVTGIFSILLHSISDFNLHIPSNALYFAFLIGLSRAVGSASFDEDR